ncbi:hypothetical protein AB4Z46_23545 [Variovorax sp. M-6]|uniref:hypothetical protein n=1 Tax=Variovorax sp. M-6 TaxID=3233041 RepID=UPI003F964296
MKPVFLTRGLCAAALLLSLAACGGGGSGTDAGAMGVTKADTPAPTAHKPDGSPVAPSTADTSADTASSPSLSWAP